MIISHKYKFIFIKTRKTAGTSIEIALGKICGDDDIVTPITENDTLQFQHISRNNRRFWNHIGATEIKQRIPKEAWDNYTKFTIERNPWDKVVSMYWWRRNTHKITDSFADYCMKICQIDKEAYKSPSDFELYTIKEKLAVDYIIKIENLVDDFSNIISKLNLPISDDLPRAKSQYRKDKKHYSYYYNDKSRNIIKEKFNREISLLDYSFEEPNDKLVGNF